MDFAEVEEKRRVREERLLRRRVLAGDAEAWRRLYDSCFDSVFTSVLMRVGGRVDRAEDITQEAWLVAVRRIADFDPGRGSFEGWVRGVGANLVRNAMRRQRALRQQPGAGVEELAAPGDDAAERLELSERIAVTFSALPAAYQGVLRAKYSEQLSVAEIAARSGGTEKAVESLLSRARVAFRAAFQRIAPAGDR